MLRPLERYWYLSLSRDLVSNIIRYGAITDCHPTYSPGISHPRSRDPWTIYLSCSLFEYISDLILDMTANCSKLPITAEARLAQIHVPHVPPAYPTPTEGILGGLREPLAIQIYLGFSFWRNGKRRDRMDDWGLVGDGVDSGGSGGLFEPSGGTIHGGTNSWFLCAREEKAHRVFILTIWNSKRGWPGNEGAALGKTDQPVKNKLFVPWEPVSNPHQSVRVYNR